MPVIGCVTIVRSAPIVMPETVIQSQFAESEDCMFRIEFYAIDVCSGKVVATPKFDYYVSAAEIPVVLAEWIVTPGAIFELIANITADTDFTTWYARTDSADFPRIAIKPVVPVS